MAIGVIDVGSNTARLLVMKCGKAIRSEPVLLRLGADVEQFGRIPASKLAATSAVVGRLADVARAAGAEQLEALITSPGRQAANGDQLREALAAAAGCPARVLTAVEEGRLAFAGAIEEAAPAPRRVVAVVDVGGGSAQVVVGTRREGPQWVRSIDLGSQRLTSRLLSADPPGSDAVELARSEVGRYVSEPVPPPSYAIAVGGSARAAKRMVGARLGPDELERALAILTGTSTKRVAANFAIDAGRIRTLAAGIVLLTALQARLGTPLRVVRGGLREGALADLAARRAAAA
jgi:exopolyphosphatase/guanosine-5'-triphosphate,3'-diphosphate pyrophosphatase